MQYCSLEGNHFPSTTINFSSGLACVTYKKLELGRKRENSERRDPVEEKNISLVFIWAEFNYSVNSLSLAAALKTCPSFWGEQELTPPGPPHLMHLLCRPAALRPAWTWLLEQELCTGSGVQPSHICLLSVCRAAPAAPPPDATHSLTQGRTDTLHGLLQERLPGSGPPCEKGVSRAALLMVLVLIDVVILRFSCP